MESAIGREFPPQLRELLAVCGGQAPEAECPFDYLRLLSPAEIVAIHTRLADWAGDSTEPAEQPAHYSHSGLAPGWIPWMGGFQEPGAPFSGDALMVDTDPGERGQYGQVFLRPNVPDLADPAGSILEVLEGIAADLESGAATLVTVTVGDEQVPVTIRIPSLD